MQLAGYLAHTLRLPKLKQCVSLRHGHADCGGGLLKVSPQSRIRSE